MSSKRRLVVYVDVDDTLVRSAGTKRMPIPSVVAHVKELAKADAELYCWSTAGAEYALSEDGIDDLHDEALLGARQVLDAPPSAAAASGPGRAF